MIGFRWREKPSGSMVVVTMMAVACLSLLLSTTTAFRSHPNTTFLTARGPSNRPSHRTLFPTIHSPPSAFRTTTTTIATSRYANRDPYLDTETESDLESKMSIDETPKRSSDDNSQAYTTIPPLSLSSIVTGVFAMVLFVAFWPLLALLRSTASPIDGFDIDMFMALKGIIEPSTMAGSDSTIMELPSLSPAEQLVGSFFGPPR